MRLNYFTDQQDAIILYLLPTLIKPKNPGRKGKKTSEESEPPKN